MSRSPTRQLSSAADSGLGMALEASRVLVHDARESAEDRLRQRSLAREVLAVGRARGGLGHAGRRERGVPVLVPALERVVVELRVELDAPGARAGAERLDRAA